MFAILLIAFALWMAITVYAIIFISGKKSNPNQCQYWSTNYCPHNHKALTIDLKECRSCPRRANCVVAQIAQAD